jgi:hypothetical protein
LLQGLSWSGPRHEVGLGMGPVQSATTPPHAWQEQPCLPRPGPAAHQPSSLCMCACAVYFPLIPFRESGSEQQLLPCMAGNFGYVLGPLWIALAMAGVTAVPTRLLVFPPPLVGVELGHVCGGCSFLQVPCLLQCPAADLKLLWT